MKSWADPPSQTFPPFQAALENTLRRIHRDQRRTSDPVCQLLNDMEERLDDPDFGVEDMERLCPPGSHTDLQFLVDLGFKPKVYFEQCRFDLARFLVCETDVRVGVIAELLGYKDPKLFSRWFERRAGMAPEKLRVAQRAFKAAQSPMRASIPQESWVSARIWHLCLLGCARPKEAANLIRTLRATYPGAAREA